MNESGDVTGLLHAWRNGDEAALDRLAPYVYQELRRLARKYMSAEPAQHTLQATALVNEAYIRLAGGDIDYQNRKHFYVVAARMMRRVLVDHARAKGRKKRGDGVSSVTLNEDVAADAGADVPILALDQALDELAGSDPRMADAVELIFFGGLTVDDAAEVLNVSTTTVYEDLRFARAWIKKSMA